MFSEIKTGLTHEIEKRVSSEDSATAFGSGMVEVFATPAMIALMEKTSLECVNRLLPDGFSTVGTEVNIQHLKATAIGKTVTPRHRGGPAPATQSSFPGNAPWIPNSRCSHAGSSRA